MVVVGGGLAGLCGSVGLTLWANAHHRGYRWDEQGDRHEHTYVDADQRDSARTLAGYTAVGALIGTIGLYLLVPRLKEYRRVSAEMRPLVQRRAQLSRWLRESFYIGARRGGFAAGVPF